VATVLFVHPWNFHEEGVKFSPTDLRHAWRSAPLGVVQLATEVRAAGHTVQICDLERDLVRNGGDLPKTLDGLVASIERLRPDVVGVTVLSVRYLEAKKIVHLCGELRSTSGLRFKVVAGGVHPTCEPGSMLEDNPALDVVFAGEADGPFPGWLTEYRNAETPGIAFRSKSRVVVNPPWHVPDLDQLPFPDWSLIDLDLYAAPSRTVHGQHREAVRSLDIVTSRGCAYRCHFCAYNNAKYRCNSPTYVVDHLTKMLDTYAIEAIYFLDSSMGNNRVQLESICMKIIESGMASRFIWSANMRANQVDESLLRLMWRAGCRKLLYGFESGSQRILDAMNKKCTVADNERAAALHKELGFPYHASMIVGYPGETVEDMEMTIRWIEKVRPPLVGINTYVPLPGSQDYANLKKAGRIAVSDPRAWRLLGEVNNRESHIYAEMPADTFWRLYDRLVDLAAPGQAGASAPARSGMARAKNALRRLLRRHR
jgi:radical SAM superfamily enzyme YgiQ (UPF0313 family)